MRLMTSVLLTRTGPGGARELLLGRKLRGFGEGKVTMPGGKVEAGETPAEAAARELKEETDVIVALADLTQAADLRFRFPARPDWDLRLLIFTATVFEGVPRDGDEIAAAWVPEDTVPYALMWDDARLWLPRVLAGEKVAADIVYAADNETVESCSPAL